MHTATVYRINTPQVISENIDGEVVIANLQTGIYYSMQRVGAEVWPLFENGISGDDLLKTAMETYSGNVSEIETSLGEFVTKLLAERLIIEVRGLQSQRPKEAHRANGTDLHPFEKPVIESYNDMKDLLLLDPIHDVDETGWPAPKPKQ